MLGEDVVEEPRLERRVLARPGRVRSRRRAFERDVAPNADAEEAAARRFDHPQLAAPRESTSVARTSRSSAFSSSSVPTRPGARPLGGSAR
ncbi:MAG: hypothetical protein U0470_04970 [Anaerolineae bacterium]